MSKYNPMEIFKKITNEMCLCAAILISKLNYTKIVQFENEHYYAANQNSTGAMKIKQSMKECSFQTSNNPEQAVQNVTKEILIELPSKDSIKKVFAIKEAVYT
ncbi:Hypothetical protein CINCED_3A014482 [Cinara cedri]|uniref:Uncharacterized protein n=1 Tax=Cinara cedri TaxID=506608 RepID=A0A5E4NAL2_9HEMI|nr:Hypothetical protein CINCED_3A014482 [Cinara cedri]